MNLTINGLPKRVDSVETVQDLLQSLGLDPRGVVVEVNERIVKRSDVESTPVQENDHVEILRFVGGG